MPSGTVFRKGHVFFMISEQHNEKIIDQAVQHPVLVGIILKTFIIGHVKDLHQFFVPIRFKMQKRMRIHFIQNPAEEIR